MISIKSISASKSIKNSFWIIGEQIVQALINMIVSVLSARYLGPSGFGLLNYTASFVMFFTSIAGLGMDSVIIKNLIEDPDREGEYLGSCAWFRVLASVISIVALMLVLTLLNPGEPLALLLGFLQSLQLIFQSMYILDPWFQRHLKSKYVSIGKLIACIVVAVYRMGLLVTGQSIVWFALSNVLTYAIMALVMYLFYRKESNQRLSVKWNTGMRVLNDSYHYILGRIMIAVYMQIDKIMIGQMMTDTDVGLYATATLICGMWTFVPVALINSFRPMIMEYKVQGEEEMYQLRLRQLYSAVIWICIAASTVICIFARIAIHILYGAAYAGAVSPLRIAIWFEVFSIIGTARNVWIVSEGKNRYVKYFFLAGAVVNLVLNTFLIPIYGINGAAWATLVTEITSGLIVPLLFRETRIHTKIVLEAFTLAWYFKPVLRRSR